MGKKQKNVKLSIVCRQFIDLETKEVEYLYVALDERKTPIFAIGGSNEREVEQTFIDLHPTKLIKNSSKKQLIHKGKFKRITTEKL